MTIMDRLNTDFESVFKSFADGKASSSENVAAALSLPQPRAAATINFNSTLAPATGVGSATAPDFTDPPVAVAAINSITVQS